jgi:hypothetical protein
VQGPNKTNFNRKLQLGPYGPSKGIPQVILSRVNIQRKSSNFLLHIVQKIIPADPSLANIFSPLRFISSCCICRVLNIYFGAFIYQLLLLKLTPHTLTLFSQPLLQRRAIKRLIWGTVQKARDAGFAIFD